MSEHDDDLPAGDRAGFGDVKAPGWDAIDRAVGMVYPGQTPHQFTSRSPYDLDGRSPLPAVTVWEARAPDSWHYVSYGLTELFDKDSPIPDLSGFGIELTLRVPRLEGEQRPPEWGLRLIQMLGHYVLSRKKGFDSGHCVDLGGAITGDPDDATTQLVGLVCAPDPVLRPMDTVHGRVIFMQLVGLTSGELKVFQDLELDAQVGALADLVPSGLTDLRRDSWLEHPELSKVLRRYKLGIGLE